MSAQRQFTVFSRLLHWTMAIMVLAMLFIGISMVASLADYHRLVSIHRPLGIAILALVVVRLVNRFVNPPPPLPDHMQSWERFAAASSHIVLYALLFAMPLVGWAMLSAARYPIVLYGALHLPPILPQDPMLYAALRRVHTYLAYLLFATFLAHLGAALLHGLVYRDGVFASMAPWQSRAARTHRLPRTPATTS
jgi:cytochrome b561